jgi:ubiquinone/menaquinone biosynthesis C-methylase UbiE
VPSRAQRVERLTIRRPARNALDLGTGSGVQALTIGPGNSFSNCAYKNVNVDGGAAATII